MNLFFLKRILLQVINKRGQARRKLILIFIWGTIINKTRSGSGRDYFTATL